MSTNALIHFSIGCGKKRHGSILVVVVVAGLILSLIGAALLGMGAQSRIESSKQVHSAAARCAADAGLYKAIQVLNNALANRTWTNSILPSFTNEMIPGSDSSFTVTSVFTAGQYQIESTGYSGLARRTIRAKLRLDGLFNFALQCQDSIILKAGTVIDAIDSRVSMNPSDTDAIAVIGTNSTAANMVTLNNGVVVKGDVVVGYSGDTNTVIKDLGWQTQDRYAAPDYMDFPPVLPPPFNGPDSLITINGGTTTIGGPGGGSLPAVGRYSGINIKQSGILKVVGDVVLHITGTIDMGQGCEILIDPASSGSLKIYLNGDFLADNSAGINNATNDPKCFMLYGINPVSQTLNLKAKTDAFGAVYAPNANLTVYAGGNLYGSFTARNFELKNPSAFYYDTALHDVLPTDEGAHFIIDRWSEDAGI